jgi:diguanylate cyclase
MFVRGYKVDYYKCSKKKLIEELKDAKTLVKQLLDEKEQEANHEFAWSGSLGHWYWNIASNSMFFNPLQVTSIGYKQSDLPKNVNFDFFVSKMHPDDQKRVVDLMKSYLNGQSQYYEAEYRIKTKDNKWKWFYDRASITQKDEKDNPIFISGVVFDITERKEKEFTLEEKNRILAHQSCTDELTGVINRRGIFYELDNRMSQSMNSNYPLSIAMFDIDFFKNINDSFGHLEGDKVLVDVAKIFSDSIRGLDTVGRYGGDEFLVIFPNTKLNNALIVCEKIRDEVEKYGETSQAKITISGGVALYNNEERNKFIEAADCRLYKAKKAGKNKIVFQ